MKHIGLISDTHGCWDERFALHFEQCDEIWHAGDIGSTEVADRLAALHPLRAVCGNVDGGDLRYRFPAVLRWSCEQVDVMMTHIGGYPGRYDRSISQQLFARPPKLFISGHSHILKAVNDPRLNLLHLNPGAAGRQGWQKVRTLMRFVIDGADIRDLEIIELNN